MEVGSLAVGVYGVARLGYGIISSSTRATASIMIESGSAGQKIAFAANQSKTKINLEKISQKNHGIAKMLENYLGRDSKAFHNNCKDLIIESKDGMKQFRIDMNHTFPHKNPHSHLIEYEAKKGRKFELLNERIYPKDVYPE